MYLHPFIPSGRLAPAPLTRSSTRALSRLSDSKLLNIIPSYLLSPFFGIPAGMYFLHHCVMHHVENNIFPWDVSSTEPYQRDNFLHFLHYWLRFLIAIWVELPYYAWVRGRKAMAVSSAACILGTLVGYALLYQVSASGRGSGFGLWGSWFGFRVFVCLPNPFCRVCCVCMCVCVFVRLCVCSKTPQEADAEGACNRV